MPRFHNEYDLSLAERKPERTIVTVPERDSVQRITIHLEPDGFVQLKRVPNGWNLATNLTDIIQASDSGSGEQDDGSEPRKSGFKGVLKDKLDKVTLPIGQTSK